ncbi:MAG: hypothetical protein JRD68_16720 [Deltaproteobacteria bacterium]|nr:hypothetical protein [Deltaproteobacteria bacterium]
MPDDEILKLTAKAAKTAITLREFIQNALISGAEAGALEALLLDDLRNNGRIFGEFNRAIKATSNGVINNFRDSGALAEFGVDDDFRWAAVLVNTCPDCLARHNGPARSWEEWEAQGLPRRGFTVCKQNCKCMLIPVDEMTELLPIKRNKKRV